MFNYLFELFIMYFLIVFVGLSVMVLVVELMQIINFGFNLINVFFYLYVLDSFKVNSLFFVYFYWCYGIVQDVFNNK